MENKDKFTKILIVILILLIIFLGWRIEGLKKQASDQNEEWKKSIIANDSLTKEADGRYAKLVNYYASERDLKNELKDANLELYKIIKKQNEKLLSITNAVISLQGMVSEGFGKTDPVDSNLINLTLKYPEDKNPFITWGGSVNKTNSFYKGEWTFGKLPLQIILTEEKRGLWKSRLVGPSWLLVDSMTINSLPPEQYNPIVQRKIEFLVGGGYVKSLVPSGPNAIGIGGGITLFDRHNIIINATTNKDIGIYYYYKFRSFKRRK